MYESIGRSLGTDYFRIADQLIGVVVWARDVADGQVKGFLVEKGTPG